MDNSIKPKREVKISLKRSIEALEVDQYVVFPLSKSEISVRNAASRAKASGRKYSVSVTEKGYVVTRTQ